ncbi:hypothetical protein ACFQ1S_13095 [Kibdelosporangium lantanae]|uniref:PH domain-containing protein n=1 Tax=Kibdelosporangium lantanae TaxID=1497396 RepID=A0ABW3M6S9_9PSEU
MARTFLRILDVVMVVVWAGGIVWIIVDEPTAPLPLIPVCGLYVAVRFVFPFLTGRGRRPGEIPPPTGQPLAETKSGGRIGFIMRFNGPMMHVAVYQDRLVIRAMWLEHTIMSDEIVDITDGYLGGVRIMHRATGTRSPIWLHNIDIKVRNELIRLHHAPFQGRTRSKSENQP